MTKERKKRIFPQGEFQPSEERQKLFAIYWAEAQTRQRLSSDNFDKSVLTYSSSGLALSVAFLKDIVPFSGAHFLWTLYSSWLFFMMATGLTITSFLVSYKTQDLAVESAEEYYLKGNDDALNRKTWHTTVVIWSNRLAGASFVMALIATCLFVGLNLLAKDNQMKKAGIAQDGMPPAMMPRVSGEKGAKNSPPATNPSPPAIQPQARRMQPASTIPPGSSGS